MSQPLVHPRCHWVAVAAGAALCTASLAAAAAPAIVVDGANGQPRAILANRDDDDRDRVPDADDERVNGPSDERDLAPLVLRVTDPRVVTVRVSSGVAPLRFFLRGADGWHHGGLRVAAVPVEGAGAITFGVESVDWAGVPVGWDGSATVDVEGVDAEGAVVGGARAACRVAPVLLRPATAPAREVFVATGRYDNEAFVTALRAALEPLGLPLAVHPAADWREMWMQDTMEIGVASIPGVRMHVVLAGLRGADGFPPTLLGPDMAVARVAEPRGLGGGDAWADWYGNLEVSPPSAAHPSGRVIYGRNTASGESFHPDVVRFLAAQGTQPPVWIDTSWLAIKHVDEIVAFLPGADGRGVLLVPDPEEGLRLAGDLAADATAAEASRRIAKRITEMLVGSAGPPRAGTAAEDRAEGGRAPGLVELLGWDHDRVIRLPVAFRAPAAGLEAAGGVAGAGSAWSNPVNSLFVNGTVICGSADMPDPVRETCRERFRAAGAKAVVFIDDGAYQRRGGNVHCATNARRE